MKLSRAPLDGRFCDPRRRCSSADSLSQGSVRCPFILNCYEPCTKGVWGEEGWGRGCIFCVEGRACCCGGSRSHHHLALAARTQSRVSLSHTQPKRLYPAEQTRKYFILCFHNESYELAAIRKRNYASFVTMSFFNCVWLANQVFLPTRKHRTRWREVHA